MKKALKSLLLLSFVAVSACSWFEEKEPLPSTLDRRAPMFNASGPASFPNQNLDPITAGYADSPMAGMPPLGGMPAAPEPPMFIGSNGVQPTPTFAPVSSAPMGSLPMASPVDMSAAENAAVGLPPQRRAPSFNQALANPNTTALPLTALPAPRAPVNAMPLPIIQGRDEFPRLAQIPAAPTAPIPAQMDDRVEQMRADLDAANQRTNMTPLPEISPVTQQFKKPMPTAQSSGQPSTNFASLKPLPNTPIHKIADEPRVLNTQGYSAPTQSQNVTRLSDLRPISNTSRKSSYGSSRSSSRYMNVDMERHSTKYGEY